MATINFDGFGHVEYEAVTGTKTLDAGDSGVVQNVTASTVVTLPASAAATAGVTYLIRIGANGKTVEIAPNSADKIVGGGLTAADDKSIYFTNQPVGSYVVLTANAAATTDSAWVIQKISGTISREA
jgi:hypothetical protein